MLKSKANWKFNDMASESHDTSQTMMDILLEARGVHTVEERQEFLHPSLTDLASPENFHGIAKAKERVLHAIENNEEIIIYGDYDADGITSTTLLLHVFLDLGAACEFYIPNRFSEGYGLNKQAIKKFHDEGASLIITVDNGIANIEEVAYANSLGLDVIITDHHEAQEEIPDAYAIIHPKLSDAYEFKDLAGVGVAFQFAHYLLDEMPTHLLELVAIGTIADLVPLQGENRILAYYGLKALNTSTNLGLQALKQACNMEPTKILTERDVGFMIAPRLNAVGRLQNASLAVDLLLTMDAGEAEEIALQVEALNSERQEIVKQIVKEAEKRVDPTDGIIILYDETWHQGVLGIAASRLVRTFDRPVIMLTYKKETNELKGSARSIPAFHLFDNGMQVKHLFTQFGGHSQAAGMTFPFDNLAEIKTALNKAVWQQLTEADFKQEIDMIQNITLNEMTEAFVEQVNMLAPFGMGNREPIFHFKGVPSQIKQLGQHQQHLKMQFREDTLFFDVIGFQFGPLYYLISQGVDVSVVGKLQINEWNGNKTVQMLLEDMEIDTWQLFDYRARQQERNFIPYTENFTGNLLVGHSREKLEQMANSFKNAKILTYDDVTAEIGPTDVLYICDMPNDLSLLQQLIEKINPTRIHVSYGITDDAFLQTIPNREEFKWLYGFVMKYQPIKLKNEIGRIMKLKKWSKEKVIFMFKVFIDLKFITVNDNVISLNGTVSKTPLEQSATYQQRIAQGTIEETLYYSTYDSLKEWFAQYVKQDDLNREEVTHGL